MLLSECNHFCKCDFFGCKNRGKYIFSKHGPLKRDLCFCEECVRELHGEISKILTPKALKSPFKLNQKLRRNGDEGR